MLLGVVLEMYREIFLYITLNSVELSMQGQCPRVFVDKAYFKSY